ncbi:class I SAM-dependent methyltransferase [Mesorhizobium sp.]|uniref:class I SAM-dependent methyltransferase n=1 Tax=Mesorhizobium sp. TaxID=1871066 RepID=UPI0025F39046|nr:class I SAM-dependent methyltransferase [Mesorhizobium sp.]
MNGMASRRKSEVRKTLRELYAEHEGKVSDKWSIYLDAYDRIFAEFRNKPVRLLEIGVQNGGSLEIWRRYFQQAELVLGSDINPACGKLIFEDEKIAVVVGDVNADETERDIIARSEKFDIIIDDGSHRSSDIIRAFVRYFPRLAEGGIYVAEDLHCSYWQAYDGGLYDPFSSMSFFKRLLDVVNQEHWGLDRPRIDALAAFAERNEVTFDEASLASIYAIEFFNSLCVVRKGSSGENVLGRRIAGGRVALVEDGIVSANGTLNQPRDETKNPWSLHSTTMEMEIGINRESVKLHEAQMQALQRELLHTRSKEKQLHDLLDAVYFSTSWRVTMPLRAAKRLLVAFRK